MIVKVLEPENFSNIAVKMLSEHSEVILKDDPLYRCEEADVLFIRLKYQMDESFLTSFTNLKYIVSPTTGEDHVDKTFLKRQNIRLLTLKGESEFLASIPATAEFTWGLLLALSRNIPSAFTSVLNEKWDRDTFRGHDIYRKTIALVGYGRISKLITKFALAFGMQVKTYDPNVKVFDEHVTACSSLEELMLDTDVLSVHASLNESTKNLITKSLLSKLPSNALLLNTSRGEIINNYDLLEALQDGLIAGAALDVIPDERAGENDIKSKLIAYAEKHTNLIITPHLGGATVESMAMTEIFMSKKLIANF